jgi:hypothetical protein
MKPLKSLIVIAVFSEVIASCGSNQNGSSSTDSTSISNDQNMEGGATGGTGSDTGTGSAMGTTTDSSGGAMMDSGMRGQADSTSPR